MQMCCQLEAQSVHKSTPRAVPTGVNLHDDCMCQVRALLFDGFWWTSIATRT